MTRTAWRRSGAGRSEDASRTDHYTRDDEAVINRKLYAIERGIAARAG